jgi:glycosyltransferase involved in cell wall biosynthesis
MKKLVFYSVFLNHHQARVADELYKRLGDGYVFVELVKCRESKGCTEDFSGRPYLLRAWESSASYQQAMEYARTAEVCVLSGIWSLPFERERLKRNLLTLDMSERPLKLGLINIISKMNLMTILYFCAGNWWHKPFYKLCCSAYTKPDYNRMGMFKHKCYKWGYFTQVAEDFDVEASIQDTSMSGVTSLMWCARFLTLKHPEVVVEMAARLKAKGYRFVVDIYGDECVPAKFEKTYPKKRLRELIQRLEVEDCVHLKGNLPNGQILQEMRQHSIFLFTSNSREGWGAVANESMANGCALVASDAIGSTPYLIEDGVNGMTYRNGSVDSLTEKVEWLLTHPKEMNEMRRQGCRTMQKLWSPAVAADNLLTLIQNLQAGKSCENAEGPCSKA